MPHSYKFQTKSDNFISASLAKPDIRPKNIKQILANLPWGDSIAATSAMFSMIQTMNNAHYQPTERYRALELIRPQLCTLSLSFHRKIIGLYPPLPLKIKQQFNLVEKLDTEMARGYEQILKTLLNRPTDQNPAKQNKAMIATCLQRIVKHKSRILKKRYLSYSCCPEKIWRDIHRCYQQAQQHDLQNTQVIDTTLYHNQNTTVTKTYLQIVLLELANPYQLQLGESDKLYELLESWCEMAKIEPHRPRLKPAYFVVDCNQDRITASKSEKINELNSFIINCQSLAQFIENQFLQGNLRFRQGNQQHSKSICVTEQLMRRLIDSWSIVGRRRFSRTRRSENVSLALGIDSIHQLLQNLAISDGNGSELDNSDSAVSSKVMKKTNFALQQNSASKVPQPSHPNHSEQENFAHLSSQSIGKPTWSMVDESASGCRLLWQYHDSPKARIGDVVYLHDRTVPAEANCILGIICWMKQVENYGLLMGLKLLAPEVDRVKLSIPGKGKNATTDIENGLLLPGLKNINQPATLITSSFCYKADFNLSMQEQTSRSKIKLRKNVKDTGIISQFEFVSLNSSPHEMAEEMPTSIESEHWFLLD